MGLLPVSALPADAVPVTQAYGDSAALGSIFKYARSDHRHGMPSPPHWTRHSTQTLGAPANGFTFSSLPARDVWRLTGRAFKVDNGGGLASLSLIFNNDSPANKHNFKYTRFSAASALVGASLTAAGACTLTEGVDWYGTGGILFDILIGKTGNDGSSDGALYMAQIMGFENMTLAYGKWFGAVAITQIELRFSGTNIMAAESHATLSYLNST